MNQILLIWFMLFYLTSFIRVNKEKHNVYATAVLTIDKVSTKDLQTEFKCIGKGLYTEAFRGLRINGRGWWQDHPLLFIAKMI